MKITSVNNDLIKETAKLLRGKYREETGLFLLEGKKCIEEALNSDVEIEHIFSTEGFEDLPQRIEVTEPVLSKISDAKTAPKAVAVAKQVKHQWSNDYKKVVLLEGIKDAGNLGTILRTAAAFGIDAIVLHGDTVDLYNPKCVRSAVGNLWKVPVFKINDLSVFEGFERVATLPRIEDEPQGESPLPNPPPRRGNDTRLVNLSEYTPAERVLIMFGSEADGLSEELKNFATKNVTIEMVSDVESLNLSVSAAVVMYKIMRITDS